MIEETLFSETPDLSHPLSPKQMTIRTCSVDYAIRLNMEWHSRVPIIESSNIIRNRHYCCFVAEFNQRPYAVAIWSSPIAANRLKNGQRLLELRRMAICDEAPKNTATWMISKMTRHIKHSFPDIVRLISYQDTESHHGTIYKASNWHQASTSHLKDWTSNGRRKRNAPQTSAPKIRWEYQLRDEPDEEIKQPKATQESMFN